MGNHRVNPFARNNVLPPRETRLTDAFGRDLIVGDLVLIPKPSVNSFVIQAIAPELSPGAPPNLVRVTLLQQVTLHVRAETGAKELILINPAMVPEDAPTVDVPAGPTGGATAGVVLTDAPAPPGETKES